MAEAFFTSQQKIALGILAVGFSCAAIENLRHPILSTAERGDINFTALKFLAAKGTCGDLKKNADVFFWRITSGETTIQLKTDDALCHSRSPGDFPDRYEVQLPGRLFGLGWVSVGEIERLELREYRVLVKAGLIKADIH